MVSALITTHRNVIENILLLYVITCNDILISPIVTLQEHAIITMILHGYAHPFIYSATGYEIYLCVVPIKVIDKDGEAKQYFSLLLMLLYGVGYVVFLRSARLITNIKMDSVKPQICLSNSNFQEKQDNEINLIQTACIQLTPLPCLAWCQAVNWHEKPTANQMK